MIGHTVFLIGEIWTLEVQVRKAGDCFKLCLISHTSRNMEDSGVKSDLNCGALAQESSEKRKLICDLEIILVIFW